MLLYTRPVRCSWDSWSHNNNNLICFVFIFTQNPLESDFSRVMWSPTHIQVTGNSGSDVQCKDRSQSNVELQILLFTLLASIRRSLLIHPIVWCLNRPKDRSITKKNCGNSHPYLPLSINSNPLPHLLTPHLTTCFYTRPSAHVNNGVVENHSIIVSHWRRQRNK